MHTLDDLDAAVAAQRRPGLPRPATRSRCTCGSWRATASAVQVFQGVVIRRQGGGVRETFTVRKVSFGVGVERTFPVHTPIIEQDRGRHPRRRPPGQALLPA